MPVVCKQNLIPWKREAQVLWNVLEIMFVLEIKKETTALRKQFSSSCMLFIFWRFFSSASNKKQSYLTFVIKAEVNCEAIPITRDTD